MKNIEISTPDGKTLAITAPDGATPDQIHAAAQQAVAHYSQTMKPQSPMDKSIEQEGPGLQDVSMTPVTSSDIQQGGQQAAEAIGAKGYPKTGAAVGTAVQMLPDLAMTAATGGLGAEARAAAKAGELGLAGRVVSGPARAVAGQAIGDAQAAAGLDNSVVPSLNRMTSKLDMPKGAKTTKDYITAVSDAVNSGKMSVQDLLEHHKLLTDLLANEPTGLAKMFGQGVSKLGKSGVAEAAKTDANIVRQINAAVPGRADAAANYQAAMIRNKGYKAAGGAALAAISGNRLTDILQKVLGK